MLRAAALLLLVIAQTAVLGAPADAADGRIRYVSTSGDLPVVHCAAGGQSDPWPSIKYALRCLGPGDTLVVAGGVYDERIGYNVGNGTRDIQAGTAARPILVVNAPGEQPVIRGYLRLQDASHWIFSGIDVTSDGAPYGSGEMLVKFRGGTGWVFANGEVWDAPTYGAVRVEPSDTTPTDFTFVGNCVHHTRTVHPPFQDHNFYIASSDGGVVEHNRIFEAPNGQNIKVGDANSDVRSLIIRNNTMHAAVQNVLVFGGSSDVRIERNLMGEVGGRDWYPNVRGFQLRGTGNVAVDNIGFGSERFLLTGSDGGGSTQSIADVDNLHPVTTGYDSTTCAGFHPTNPAVAGYGATDVSRERQLGRIVLTGDWDGDGIETGGWYDPSTSTWRLSNDHDHGTADLVFRYGAPGDKPVVGDWDGDGTTTIGIVRGRNQWYLTDGIGPGPADYDFTYGRPGDLPVIGDWNGDGKDTPGLVRGRQWYLSNSKQGGWADYDFAYGRPGDHPIAGDWDGDGQDTPGLLRGNQWYMSDSKQGGWADYDFSYGRLSDAITVGDWNGDGRSTPSIVRGFEWFISNSKQGGTADFAYTLPG